MFSLSIYAGAYVTEIVRAGITSIEPGQIEAARALGLSRRPHFPPRRADAGAGRVYPALTSQFILIMLASSIVSTISVPELTGAANDVQGLTFRSLEAYLVVAGLYLVLDRAVQNRCSPAWTARALRLPAGGERGMFQTFSLRHVEYLAQAGPGRCCFRSSRCAGGASSALSLMLARIRADAAAAGPGIGLYLRHPGHAAAGAAVHRLFRHGLAGLDVPPLVAAGVAFTLYAAAFLGDIWRGAIEAMG